LTSRALTAHKLEVLRDILRRRSPDLVHDFEDHLRCGLTDDQRENLRRIIGEELCAAGLDSDDEPTRYGLILEGIIDELGML
jgi:hypothetical protein